MSEFEKISEGIINHEKFLSLKNDPHHGINRYEHIMRVAKYTYKVSKKLKNIDYISATRGALLHDYFNDADYINTKGMKKASMHPVIALNNARREFELNEKEENMIVSHMFPYGDIMPNCKESWILTLVDKIVAIYECLRYKQKEQFTIWILFLINFIRIQ